MGAICSKSQSADIEVAPPQILVDGQDERLVTAFGKGMKPVCFLGAAFHLKSVLQRRVAAARFARERSSKHADSLLEKSMRIARASVERHGEADHGSVELLKQRLEFANLAGENIDPDGNCQFRALSYQLFGSQDHHAHVRRRCCDEMQRAHGSYSVFFDACEFETFVKHMRCGRTWGDELTLRAAADTFCCTVHVITSTPENWHLRYEPQGQSVKALFLTYISPVHYNAVCRERAAAPP